MILQNLYESRESRLNELAPYIGDPNIFISFTEINKLGINPQPKDETTPAGIYAYPLTTSFYQDILNKTVPYGLYREYFYLFEGRGNIINLGEYTINDLESDLARLIDHWKLIAPSIDLAAALVNKYSNEGSSNIPAAKFWSATKGFSLRISKNTGRAPYAVWNGVLRRLGYDGIIDPGMGIIHKLEPSQAIFLTKSACNVIGAWNNNLGY